MFDFLQTSLVYVVPFVFVLGLVVTVHEFGHFLAAKWCGVAIDRFSIGFGRALYSRTDRAGVEWRVGWIPLGGYVKFSGDDNAASVPDQEDLDDMRREVERREGREALSRYFHFKPLWQRAFITAAGPLANFLLAIVLFAILLVSFGEMVLAPRVAGVTPGSAAEAAGFREGDLILKANGKPLESFFDLQKIVALRAGVPIDFEVDRGGAVVAITATPRKGSVDALVGPQEAGVLGLEASGDRAYRVRKHFGPVEAVVGGVERTWDVLTTTVYMLGRIVTGKIGADQIGGPLGIAQASGAVAASGAQGAPNVWFGLFGGGVALLSWAAVVSVGIGFMNLLPVPVLDGGHLLFYAYEAVARRPLGANIQAAGYRVGLALLLCLMLFATWNDLQRLRVFQFLGRLFS